MNSLLPRLAAAVLVAATLVGRPSGPADAQDLTVTDRVDIVRIESYLRSLDTVQARFEQYSSTGARGAGDFYLDRPGRMRIEYDPPDPYLYVADGFWLVFYDSELEQRSEVPLGSTLADFITREDVTLSGEVTVTGLRRDGNHLEIDLIQTEDPGSGTLTLVFADNPLDLHSWVVTDAQGITTHVMLSDKQAGIELPRRLFRAPRPTYR